MEEGQRESRRREQEEETCPVGPEVSRCDLRVPVAVLRNKFTGGGNLTVWKHRFNISLMDPSGQPAWREVAVFDSCAPDLSGADTVARARQGTAALPSVCSDPWLFLHGMVPVGVQT